MSAKHLSEGERIVVSTRTHPKVLLGPLIVLVLLLAVGAFVETRTGPGSDRWLSRVVWVLVAVGVVWFVVRPFLQWFAGSYTFTDRRLVTRTGVLTRRGHDIPLSRVSDVAVERNVNDRLLGCGTLVISDASTHGSVTLPDIPRVEEVQRRLNDLLHEIHSGRDDEGA
ncbi:PH domain-containing protein [Nocardioides acrostichi]|nr:PH domain-containing protein [Nocardioides acrostichi]